MDIEALVKVILSNEEMRQKIEELGKGLTVYISKTGDRYHKYSDCPRLLVAHGSKEVSLLSVKECMYDPCPTCRPDEG